MGCPPVVFTPPVGKLRTFAYHRVVSILKSVLYRARTLQFLWTGVALNVIVLMM